MFKSLSLTISINKSWISHLQAWLEKYQLTILLSVLSIISGIFFLYFYQNGLGLAYNDARSHLDIGRRVVEGLKPGIAQLGSVWLPLPHILMVPFIWNDFLWHSGLAGAITSMISYVITGFLIYKTLEVLKVGTLARLAAVLVFALNLNILYLQSTAMTELLLLSTTTAATYYLILWSRDDKVIDLIKSAFFIMLATLARYDGWFLFGMVSVLMLVSIFRSKGYKTAEGSIILFLTLAGVGIALWFLWNQLIFKDALYFIFGPYSAHSQQQQLDSAGDLPTKGNLLFSTKIYLYSVVYNIGAFQTVLGFLGMVLFWLDKKVKANVRFMSLALIAPLIFNIVALYFGFSVLFIQGLSGNTWFNVRYGIMVIPFIAIFIGFLIDRLPSFKFALVGLLIFVTIFSFTSFDAATVDDARVGSSQKNVTEVSSWLSQNAKDKPGFILISAASHDAIIFSSGLPMSKFIHEGTGAYWDSATKDPDRWARWIVMRTYDNSDLTYRLIKDDPGFAKYQLVDHFPFADIYELKPEYLKDLNTQPVLGHQK